MDLRLEIRPDWDSTFIDMCYVLSKRSTCVRLQTAAIVVKNLNIISIGYNGCPSGMVHCCDRWKAADLDEAQFLQEHHQWSLANELHAEINALLRCKADVQGGTIYSLYSPCIQCAKAIVAAGIKEVVYLHVYARDLESTAMLFWANDIVFRQR